MTPRAQPCAQGDDAPAPDRLRSSVDRLEAELEGLLAQLDAGSAGRGAADAAREDFEARRAALSARERDVLDLLAEGRRVTDVAERLFVSRSTVRSHLSQLFRRFEVSSQPELLELVRRAGWRPPAGASAPGGATVPTEAGAPAAPAAPAPGAPLGDEHVGTVVDLLRRAAHHLGHARLLLDAIEQGDEARGEVVGRLASLSPQERRVVDLVAGGRRAPTIAAELGLSQSTVRNHLSNVFRKLGVSSQAELGGLLHRVARPHS